MFEIKTETRKYTIKNEDSEMYFNACMETLMALETNAPVVQVVEKTEIPSFGGICMTPDKAEEKKEKTAVIPEWWREKETPAEQKAEPEKEDVRLKAFRGFMHIECEHCGKITSTCLKGWQRFFTCNNCNERLPMTEENMRKVVMDCKCGNHSEYFTNRVDGMFDIDCINCGAPVTVEWNSKKKEYRSL